LRSYREEHADNNFRFFKNMEGHDFLKLLLHSKCLVGNSSVGIRECAYLGVPVVNIGSRQNRRLRGHNVIDTDYSSANILKAIRQQVNHSRYPSDLIYGDGNAAGRIADVIARSAPDISKVISY
jgi:UDP-N-acetylglucosamine 2-epimerase